MSEGKIRWTRPLWCRTRTPKMCTKKFLMNTTDSSRSILNCSSENGGSESAQVQHHPRIVPRCRFLHQISSLGWYTTAPARAETFNYPLNRILKSTISSIARIFPLPENLPVFMAWATKEICQRLSILSFCLAHRSWRPLFSLLHPTIFHVW